MPPPSSHHTTCAADGWKSCSAGDPRPGTREPDLPQPRETQPPPGWDACVLQHPARPCQASRQMLLQLVACLPEPQHQAPPETAAERTLACAWSLRASQTQEEHKSQTPGCETCHHGVTTAPRGHTGRLCHIRQLPSALKPQARPRHSHGGDVGPAPSESQHLPADTTCQQGPLPQATRPTPGTRHAPARATASLWQGMCPGSTGVRNAHSQHHARPYPLQQTLLRATFQRAGACPRAERGARGAELPFRAHRQPCGSSPPLPGLAQPQRNTWFQNHA